MAKESVRVLNNQVGKLQTDIDKIDKQKHMLQRQIDELDKKRSRLDGDIKNIRADIIKIKA